MFKDGDNMTYKQLYNQAKEAKIVNRSKMNKAQLIAALNNAQPHVAVKAAIMPPPVPLGKQLREKVEKANPREICSFALKYVDRKEPEFLVSAFCHAKLMYGNAGIEILVEDVARHLKGHIHPQAYREYLDYLINRSPHAPNFLTKDVDEAFEGGLYMNTNGLHSRVVASIIASREGSEFPGRVILFKKLKDIGISENVSWFLANFLHSRDNGGYSIQSLANGHSVFIYNMSYSDICKFFKEGFHKELSDRPMNKWSGKYTIFEAIASIQHYKGDSVHTTMLSTMNEEPNSKFGHQVRTYSIGDLKPLIEKLEKDFA